MAKSAATLGISSERCKRGLGQQVAFRSLNVLHRFIGVSRSRTAAWQVDDMLAGFEQIGNGRWLIDAPKVPRGVSLRGALSFEGPLEGSHAACALMSFAGGQR